LSYQKKDHYHQKAKEEGYLARSAYKLQEIQKKFRLLTKNAKVLDLGCAPGAWLQVALEHIGSGGLIVGIDLEKVVSWDSRLRIIHGDALSLTKTDLPEQPFDLVLSDMAPKTSGVKIRDEAQSLELCRMAHQFSEKVLKPKGSLVVKLFEGGDSQLFIKELRVEFSEVSLFRPESTRSASKEIYVVSKGLKKKFT
jgi:23S rRNA (uridine2552-2'-O)-methyltransferase